MKSPQKLERPKGEEKKNLGKERRGQWTNEALQLAIQGLDDGYNMAEVSRKYKIPRSSIRDYYEGRTIQRKLEPKTILTNEEELQLVEYMHLMVKWDHPMTPT